MTTPIRLTILVPTYDNPRTIRNVVEMARAYADVLVVDDGSGPEARAICEQVANDGLAVVVHRGRNGGKGAAVKTGLAAAAERGYTHALQIDADAQHTFADIPRFIAAATKHPDALVLGSPVFDESVPKGRLYARKITQFWTNVESRGRVIDDPMCGFRVYPVAPALAANARGDAMDFDPEIAVRLVWNGVRVVNVPTAVRYVSREDGGVSHFRVVRDNVLISAMHSRLMLTLIGRALVGRAPPRPK